uniref:Uncharacterized protein n=1 Tax=Romanomermis culicivorax TaxID=13658 RepID=A0A915JRI1_ROMCU
MTQRRNGVIDEFHKSTIWEKTVEKRLKREATKSFCNLYKNTKKSLYGARNVFLVQKKQWCEVKKLLAKGR